MEIRLAHPNELGRILEIIADSRQHIASYGGDQWQGTYPDQATIETDILNGYGQVILVDGRVAAYVAMTGHDASYDGIYDGNWTHADKRDYLTFHRIAVGAAYRGQGVVLALLEGLMEVRQTKEFRADTHPDNKAMQHIFGKLGFKQAGKVMLADGMRLAYEKLVL